MYIVPMLFQYLLVCAGFWHPPPSFVSSPISSPLEVYKVQILPLAAVKRQQCFPTILGLTTSLSASHICKYSLKCSQSLPPLIPKAAQICKWWIIHLQKGVVDSVHADEGLDGSNVYEQKHYLWNMSCQSKIVAKQGTQSLCNGDHCIQCSR